MGLVCIALVWVWDVVPPVAWPHSLRRGTDTKRRAKPSNRSSRNVVSPRAKVEKRYLVSVLPRCRSCNCGGPQDEEREVYEGSPVEGRTIRFGCFQFSSLSAEIHGPEIRGLSPSLRRVSVRATGSAVHLEM